MVTVVSQFINFLKIKKRKICEYRVYQIFCVFDKHQKKICPVNNLNIEYFEQILTDAISLMNNYYTYRIHILNTLHFKYNTLIF